MKSSHAGLAVLSGLAATVTADALPPDDIPIMCATICGPVVELTSICNVQWKELRRREFDWPPVIEERTQDAEARVDDRLEKMRQDDQVERRSFSVIVAAPTSFPYELPADTTLDLRPTSTPTPIIPTFYTTSSTNPVSPSLPPTTTTASSSAFHSTARVRASTSSPTTVAATTSSAHWSGNVAYQKGQGLSSEDTEQACVCLNGSFDVPKVAALCASCIALAGYPENNVNVIMSDCNFTSLTWSPSKDSVVDNVRVKATKPSTTGSSHVAVVSNSDAASFRSSGLLMGIFGLVLGVGLMP
ncbi:Fc.00g083700.m01.CDS01 [Cosmosporella sp. VM-42]